MYCVFSGIFLVELNRTKQYVLGILESKINTTSPTHKPLIPACLRFLPSAFFRYPPLVSNIISPFWKNTILRFILKQLEQVLFTVTYKYHLVF